MSENTVVRRIETPRAETLYPLIVQLNPTLSFERFCALLRDMLTDSYFLIGAFCGEKLLGVSGCWVATKFYCGRYLEIDNFVVDEPWRGQRVGEKIIQFAIAEAQRLGCEAVMLDVYTDNEAANRFYDRLGFDAIGWHRIVRL